MSLNYVIQVRLRNNLQIRLILALIFDYQLYHLLCMDCQQWLEYEKQINEVE